MRKIYNRAGFLAMASTLALVAMATPVTAHAGQKTETFEARFSYDADQNPETTYRQFKHIADQECRVDRFQKSLPLRRIVNECRKDILAKAVSRTGNSELAALHGGLPRATVLIARNANSPTAVLSAKTANTAADCETGDVPLR